MACKLTSFTYIELSSLFMRYKHAIVRKSTQSINDHIHIQYLFCLFFRYFRFFAILQVGYHKMDVFNDFSTPQYAKNKC